MINVVVTVLSHNRIDLLERTLASLKRSGPPFELELVDNGSTDGSAEYVEYLGGYANRDGDYSCGHGINLCVERALQFEPDLILTSGDDLEYREGWLQKLTEFWEYAPAFIGIVGVHLEPIYRWNCIYGTVEAGPKGIKHRAYLRHTLATAICSFRPATWSLIGPHACTTGTGHNKQIFYRLLREHGLASCAMDLAEHIGEQSPAWQHDDWKRGAPVAEALPYWGIA